MYSMWKGQNHCDRVLTWPYKREAQSVYKEENEKESNREWKQETVSTVDWEQYWSKEREAIQGGGKKLQQKQGSSEKEK